MNDNDKRMLIRGMSIANGPLDERKLYAPHHHQHVSESAGGGLGHRRGRIAHREEFMEIAEEIGETFAAKFPDGLPGRASKASKGN